MFLELNALGTARIGKLHYVIYTDKHLVNYMMQDSKKGLLSFSFRVVFLRISVLRHLRKDITLRQYPMLLQWVALCIGYHVLG